jgi:tRNA (mo5U34)-methyltransferase
MSLNKRSVPPAPQGFRPESLLDGVDHWHQRWEVFAGVFTPGRNPIAEMCDAMQLPADLTGKRVLDIGAWNGCLSFECERRGAAEVLALGPEMPDCSGFDTLRRLLGSRRTRYELGSIYDLNPARYGQFDVVLCCGVLYHLRYPMLGIDNLRRVCRGELYLETHLTDWALGAFRRKLRSLAMWQFYRRDELEHDASNWFGPTACAVVEALASAGLRTRHVDAWIKGRGAFRASALAGLPEFLATATVEGVFYDTILSRMFGPKETWELPASVVAESNGGTDEFDASFFASRRWKPRKPLITRVRNKLRARRAA